MRNTYTVGNLAVLALLLLAVCAPIPTQAAVVLVEYILDSGDDSGTATQLSDGTTPTGSSFDLLAALGANPQYSLWNADTNGTRYTRIRADLRGGQNEVHAQKDRYYLPAAGTDRFSVNWSNTIGTNQTWYRFSNENWPDDNNAGDIGTPANGFVADDGVGLEKINWAMIVPESDLIVNANAIALGIVWTDLDLDGNIDTGDSLVLKYAVTATNASGQAAAFAEIDTPEELNAAVGNINPPGNDPPKFNNDPFSTANAPVDAAYSDTIAGSARDIDEDPLTYSKVGGPSWLSVAGGGDLSGTPTAGDLGANAFTVQVSDGATNNTATLNINVIDGLQLVDFKSISAGGDWEVTILGAPGDISEVVEAGDYVDFDTPEQDPVPLSAIIVGTAWGDEVVHDAAGNATVQFNLGAGDVASVVRAEETGGAVTYIMAEYLFLGNDPAGTPLVQLSDGTNALGSYVITDRDANPKFNLSFDVGGPRYTRWIADFRGKGEIEAQGSGYFNTASGTNLFHGPWINVVSNSGAQVVMSSVNWNTPPATNNAPPVNGFAPDDGVGQEEINWAMLKPESGNFGNAGAMALGILWTDNDTDGFLDTTDTYTLKYAVGALGYDQASAFAGMDTEEELNAAVGNVP